MYVSTALKKSRIFQLNNIYSVGGFWFLVSGFCFEKQCTLGHTYQAMQLVECGHHVYGLGIRFVDARRVRLAQSVGFSILDLDIPSRIYKYMLPVS